MTYQIICSKLSGNETQMLNDTQYEKLEEMKVSKLREILVEKNFISVDDDNKKWRFILSKLSSASPTYDDRILGKDTEKYVPLSDLVVGTKNEIIITNTQLKTKPDLIGFGTNWFTGGKLRVKCSLSKNKKLESINANKFEPIMLSNVVSTNQSLKLLYSNVCICCEDSAIEFGLRSWGSVGFEYNASLASGEVIRNSAVHWKPEDYDLYGETGFDAWQKGDHSIIMKAIDKVSGIDPLTKMNYMKATFKTRDMLAWRDNDAKKTYSINDKAKLKNNLSMNLSFSVACNSVSTNEQSQRAIGGDDVTPGTPTRGEIINVTYGNWSIAETKSWEEPEGTVDIYFFTFKSLEIAKKYIDRYNTMPLDEQASVWGI